MQIPVVLVTQASQPILSFFDCITKSLIKSKSTLMMLTRSLTLIRFSVLLQKGWQNNFFIMMPNNRKIVLNRESVVNGIYLNILNV